jgi:hypothetical protein
MKVHVGFDPAWHLNPTPEQPPTPNEWDILALIDTGAKQSCIDSALAQRLQLPMYDRRLVSTCNGKVLVDFCLAQIQAPSVKFIQSGTFASVPLKASGFRHEVLLGRSFLSYWKLEYDGTTGEVILTYQPLTEHSVAS